MVSQMNDTDSHFYIVFMYEFLGIDYGASMH